MGKSGKYHISRWAAGSILGIATFMLTMMGHGIQAEAAESLKINGNEIADPSTDHAAWEYKDGILTLRGTLDARAAGSRAIEFTGDLTIATESGAKILTEGQEGIYGSGNLVLDGDADLVIEAQGPYAVYAGGSITKTGSSEVTCVTSYSGSQGIYAEKNLYIQGGGLIGKGQNYGVRAGEGIYVTGANLIGRGEYNAGIRAKELSFNLGGGGYVLGKTLQGEWGIRGDHAFSYIGSVEKPADVKLKYDNWDGYVFYDVWGKTVKEIEIGKYTKKIVKPTSRTKSLNQDVLTSLNYKGAVLTSWEQVLMALAKLQTADITNAHLYGQAAVLEINLQESSGYIPADVVNVIAGKEGVGVHFYLGNGVSAVFMGTSIGSGYTGSSFVYQGSMQENGSAKEKIVDFTEKGQFGIPAALHVNLGTGAAGGTARVYAEDTSGNRAELTQCPIDGDGNITFMTGSKEKFIIVY